MNPTKTLQILRMTMNDECRQELSNVVLAAFRRPPCLLYRNWSSRLGWRVVGRGGKMLNPGGGKPNANGT